MRRKRATHQHQRAFRIGEKFRELVQILRAWAGQRHGARLHHGAFRGGVKNIFGQDHGDGARRAGFRQMEGARNRLTRLDRLDHFEHALGDVGQKPRIILFLQRQPANILAFHVANQHHQRCRIMIGGVECDHGIGRPRPAGDQRNPGAAIAHAPIGRGHEARAAFMATDHQIDARKIAQRIRQPQIAFARHAIDDVNVMGREAFGQHIADGLGHGFLS